MALRTLYCIFSDCISLLLTTAGVASDCRVLTLSAHPDYPPYQWADGQSVTGASVAATAVILREAGITMKPVYVGPWKRVLENARWGKIDMVVALKKNAERQTYMQFTSSEFYDNPFAAFIRADRELHYTGWNDLKKLRGGKTWGIVSGYPLTGLPMTICILKRQKIQARTLRN